MEHAHAEHSHHMHQEATTRDYILFLSIILGILAGATLLTFTLTAHHHILEGMRYFEGLFFLVFAVFKLMRLRDFVDAYQGYDVLAKRSRAYAYAYPFIELALAAGFLLNIALPLVLAVTAVLMGIGLIGVIKELRRGSHITCACLGTVIKLPLTQITLAEDAVMGIMAVGMLLAL
jgi:hypothetical protein